jgi:hypothetical protein
MGCGCNKKEDLPDVPLRNTVTATTNSEAVEVLKDNVRLPEIETTSVPNKQSETYNNKSNLIRRRRMRARRRRF